MTEATSATPRAQAEPGRLQRLFRWLAGDIRAALAILVLLVLVIVAVGAPWIAPYAPTAQDVNNMLAAPGPQHLLGTDDLGRDIFSRLIYGAPAWHILWKHVLPNALQPVIVQVTLLLAAALLAEASLSFLGLGIQPPNPSWGAMLARAYQYMEIAPEQMYAPGLAILVVSLAFNALGESLRIVLDPTMKDR